MTYVEVTMHKECLRDAFKEFVDEVSWSEAPTEKGGAFCFHVKKFDHDLFEVRCDRRIHCRNTGSCTVELFDFAYSFDTLWKHVLEIREKIEEIEYRER